MNGLESDDYLHVVTAPATSAVLVTRRAQTLPGLMLEDGSVVVLSWQQMVALQCAFVEFNRLLVPSQLEKFGMARATVELNK